MKQIAFDSLKCIAIILLLCIFLPTWLALFIGGVGGMMAYIVVEEFFPTPIIPTEDTKGQSI